MRVGIAPGRGAGRAPASDPRRRRTTPSSSRRSACSCGRPERSGLRGWAISEIPEAQKRGSVCAPGNLARRIPGRSVPKTVETCTPAFSNTRPLSIAIRPPPPGAPVWSRRVHGLRSNRPGARASGANGPGHSSSELFEGGDDRPCKPSNQARAARLRSSMSCMRHPRRSPRRARSAAAPRQAPAPPRRSTLSERSGGRIGDANPRVGVGVDLLRRARRFPPDHA